MSVNRNITQDQQNTSERQQDRAKHLPDPDGTNWLGHNKSSGAGIIDEGLLDGMTLVEMRRARGAVHAHLHHLRREHGLPVKKIGKRYKYIFEANALSSAGISATSATTPEGINEVTADAARESTPAVFEFGLEEHLEDYLVEHFSSIFEEDLQIYNDGEGQQYDTEAGTIDILAQEKITGHFVVIELKKGRAADRVVGQILRYMGWVNEHLCSGDQKVKGLIICADADGNLSYALEAPGIKGTISAKYYRIMFELSDTTNDG